MNIIKAAIIWFALEFVTLVGWFGVWAHFRPGINDMATAVNIDEATTAINHIVAGANIAFLAAMIIWTVWFAYAAHSSERETTYSPGYRPPDTGFKRW